MSKLRIPIVPVRRDRRFYHPRIRIEGLEQVGAGFTRFDHDIHALTGPDYQRVPEFEPVHFRYRNRIHRHDV